MLSSDQLNKILKLKVKDMNPSTIYVLAIRGNEGPNKIGVFDDRAYVVYDWTLKGTWKMNTDPSSDQTGRAHLKPGVYWYRAGDHKGRPAFVQAGEVTVHRTNQGDDTGMFAINLHDAKTNSGGTSSLGCQTWEQDDDTQNFWNSKGDGFADVMYRILKITKSQAIGHKEGIGKKFAYVLVTAAEADKLIAS